MKIGIKEELKKASEENVKLAQEISKLPKLKTYVDALMSSVNKSTKEGVKNVADNLIKACRGVSGKFKVKVEEVISKNNVEEFDKKYSEIVKDLSESSDKKEQKLVISMSNAFPHWCLELAFQLQESNFYKRLDSKNNTNTDEDDGESFKKEQTNKGSFHKLQKKWKNLFSGKARKHETFNKMKNLVVRYSEPWAIAWVNAAGNNDPISESSAIKEINALCKKKDANFITDLGSAGKFKLAGKFKDIFGDNFENNSGKIKKSLRGIIDRLVSISKKLEKKKYKGQDEEAITNKIEDYNKDKVFNEVLNEQSIFSKAWGKITTAASTVGSGIVKGGKLLGKGALKVATAPKYIVPEKIRNKIYDRFHKKGKKEEEFVELDEEK